MGPHLLEASQPPTGPGRIVRIDLPAASKLPSFQAPKLLSFSNSCAYSVRITLCLIGSFLCLELTETREQATAQAPFNHLNCLSIASTHLRGRVLRTRYTHLLLPSTFSSFLRLSFLPKANFAWPDHSILPPTRTSGITLATLRRTEHGAAHPKVMHCGHP